MIGGASDVSPTEMMGVLICSVTLKIWKKKATEKKEQRTKTSYFIELYISKLPACTGWPSRGLDFDFAEKASWIPALLPSESLHYIQKLEKKHPTLLAVTKRSGELKD